MKIALIELNPRETIGPALVDAFNVELSLAKKGNHSCKILRILSFVAEFREGEAIKMRSCPKFMTGHHASGFWVVEIWLLFFGVLSQMVCQKVPKNIISGFFVFSIL